MAVFYYPDRSAPTTTLTIAPLESFPSDRRKEKLQSRDVNPQGDAISYELGGLVEYLELVVRILSSADKTNLEAFIKNTANFSENTFGFDDDKSVQYDTVRFWFDDTEISENYVGLFSTNLLLRVDL